MQLIVDEQDRERLRVTRQHGSRAVAAPPEPADQAEPGATAGGAPDA